MTSNYEFDTQIKGWPVQPFLFVFENIADFPNKADPAALRAITIPTRLGHLLSVVQAQGYVL